MQICVLSIFYTAVNVKHNVEKKILTGFLIKFCSPGFSFDAQLSIFLAGTVSLAKQSFSVPH